MENSIHGQTQDYLQSNELLYIYQSGFQTLLKMEDILPSKYSSWWRRLEDVLKISFVFVFKRRHEDEYILINHKSSEDVFKTSSRRVGQDQYILVHTSSRRLQDVFITSCHNVFKTFSRHLPDVSQIRLKDIFKKFWRRIMKLNCFC